MNVYKVIYTQYTHKYIHKNKYIHTYIGSNAYIIPSESPHFGIKNVRMASKGSNFQNMWLR